MTIVIYSTPFLPWRCVVEKKWKQHETDVCLNKGYLLLVIPICDPVILYTFEV